MKISRKKYYFLVFLIGHLFIVWGSLYGLYFMNQTYSGELAGYLVVNTNEENLFNQHSILIFITAVMIIIGSIILIGRDKGYKSTTKLIGKTFVVVSTFVLIVFIKVAIEKAPPVSEWNHRTISIPVYLISLIISGLLLNINTEPE